MHFASNSIRQPHGIKASEFTPKVPHRVKAWVRGETDTRSCMPQLDEGVACRAVCLADCADSDRIHMRTAPKPKPSIELAPRTAQLAPKEFQAQILDGKRTRNGRQVQPEEEEEEEEEEEAKKREVPFLNDLR